MSVKVTVPGVEEGRASEVQTTEPGTGTRLKITGTLTAIGGFCGAGVGVALTYLGNVISGYPISPTLGIYAWNAGVMGAIGAILGPPLAWSLLRSVPLWRTLVEPAAAGLGATVLAMLFAPPLFPLVVPVAVTCAALRLRWEYRNVETQDQRSESDVAFPGGSSAGPDTRDAVGSSERTS
jgi:hypothetical protein